MPSQYRASTENVENVKKKNNNSIQTERHRTKGNQISSCELKLRLGGPSIHVIDDIYLKKLRRQDKTHVNLQIT